MAALPHKPSQHATAQGLVTITWHNANQDTIWGRLAARLGREPTNAEAKAEVHRILDESMCERAEAGKLAHQRGRSPASSDRGGL